MGDFQISGEVHMVDRDKLINDLFLANRYREFLKDNNLPISRKFKKSLFSQITSQLDDSQIETSFEYKKGNLKYFYQVSKNEDIVKKIYKKSGNDTKKFLENCSKVCEAATKADAIKVEDKHLDSIGEKK